MYPYSRRDTWILLLSELNTLPQHTTTQQYSAQEASKQGRMGKKDKKKKDPSKKAEKHLKQQQKASKVCVDLASCVAKPSATASISLRFPPQPSLDRIEQKAKKEGGGGGGGGGKELQEEDIEAILNEVSRARSPSVGAVSY